MCDYTHTHTYMPIYIYIYVHKLIEVCHLKSAQPCIRFLCTVVAGPEVKGFETWRNLPPAKITLKPAERQRIIQASCPWEKWLVGVI